MKIALAQVCTSRDVDANLALVGVRTAEAAAAGAELVVFPEATMRAFGHNLTDIAEPLDGPFASRVRELAAEHAITIALGMFTPGGEGRVRNTLLVTGPGVEAHYDKVHLFDAYGFRESDTVTGGDGAVRVRVGEAELGLATCYDVRFPQLFLANAGNGARAHLVVASWGAGEGKIEQWELLCRARALDSTAYVIACGQAEPGASGVEAKRGAPTGVGHSLVVSPLGEVVERLGDGPELRVVDLDLARVDEARRSLPVLQNARPVA